MPDTGSLECDTFIISSDKGPQDPFIDEKVIVQQTVEGHELIW